MTRSNPAVLLLDDLLHELQYSSYQFPIPQHLSLATTLVPDSPHKQNMWAHYKTSPTPSAQSDSESYMLPASTYDKARASSTVIPPAMILRVRRSDSSLYSRSALSPAMDTAPLLPARSPRTPPPRRPSLFFTRTVTASNLHKPLPPVPRTPTWPMPSSPLSLHLDNNVESPYRYKYSIDSDCAFMLDNVKIETESIHKLPFIPGQSYIRLPPRTPFIPDGQTAQDFPDFVFPNEKIVVPAPLTPPEEQEPFPALRDSLELRREETTTTPHKRSSSLDRLKLRATTYTPWPTSKHSRSSSKEHPNLPPVWTSLPSTLPSPPNSNSTSPTSLKPRRRKNKPSMTNLFSRGHRRATSDPSPTEQYPKLTQVTSNPRPRSKHARSASMERSGDKLVWFKRPFGSAA